MRLQSGWSAGRMPVAALMALFSSGVQGVGVSGWTLPDGSRGAGEHANNSLWEREQLGKNSRHQLKTLTATHLWKQNSKKKIA